MIERYKENFKPKQSEQNEMTKTHQSQDQITCQKQQS